MPKRKSTWIMTPAGRNAPVAASSTTSTYARLPSKRKRNARVAGYLGIEKKFVDYNSGGVINVSDDWNFHDPAAASCVNAVAQGDGESQRDGKNYEMLSFHLRGRVKLKHIDGAADLNDSSHVVRVAIVLDTMANGSQGSATNIFLTAGAAGRNIHSFRNLEYSARYRVFWDKTFVLNTLAAAREGTTFDQGEVTKMFSANITIPKKYANVGTTGTTATVSVIQNNALHIVATSDSAASPSRCTLQYECRLRYIG